MKLQTYVLNQKPLTEIPNWSVSELNGNKPFIVNNDLVSGYLELTNISDWYNYGLLINDFLFVRDRIKIIANTVGFNTLNESEKIISSEIFVVNKNNRDLVHTEEQQHYNWKTFVEASQDAREKRWKAAKSYISYVLTPIDSLDIGISTNTLSNNYIIYGIEDYDSDNIPGLFDWLGNTSIYSGGAGYSSKSYWVQEHQDNVLDILKNGNY
jgi:hypothetical protein